MTNVLLVEDAVEYQILVRSALGGGFALTSVGRADEARIAIRKQPFDLLILDVKLPEGDGFELCSQIRSLPEYEDVPIIFLTGKRETDDKVRGFSLGADDYIVKPFDPKELRARVESRILRAQVRRSSSDKLRFGDVVLHLSSQEATRQSAGAAEQNIDLTPAEFKLLCFLIKSVGRVVSREQLIQALWKNESEILDRTVDKHVSTLRKKLRATSLRIESVYSSGYVLTNEGEAATGSDRE
ncbi:MAG: response regulator transcription factor [Bdellovibrionota bacterium]